MTPEIARQGGLAAQRKHRLTTARARAMGRDGGRRRLQTLDEILGSPGGRRLARENARLVGIDVDAVMGRRAR